MHVFSTSNPDLSSAAQELKKTLPAAPSFILYFHSVAFAADQVAELISQAYPGVPSLGCSTAGELVTGKMLDGHLVVAGFSADLVAGAKVLPIVGTDVQGALHALTGPQGDPDLATHIGLILMDGLSGQEEAIMDSLGSATNLTFVGGSAGDDLQFTKTFVAANGQITQGSGALALLQVPAGFDLIKTQSFCTTGKTLTPSKVDQATRAVLEFDGKPAIAAYADALGIPSDATLSSNFITHPLGLMAGDEPYVRSPQRTEDGRLHFYCAVNEGVELAVLKGTDIIADTAQALDHSKHRALIAFNCILRTLDLKNQGKTDSFGKLFTQPTIGFSTYGEAYIGHINQTATILALH